MKKSYSPIEDGYFILNGVKTKVLSTESFYSTYDFGADKVVESTDWKSIEDVNVVTTAGNVTVVKTIEEIGADVIVDNVNGVAQESKKERIFEVVVDISTGNMDAGTTLIALVKDADGATIETINFTFGAVTAASSETFIFKPGGLVKAEDVEFTFEFIDSAATYDADVTINVSSITNDAEAVLFTVGLAVGGAPATVNCEIVDNDGLAITEVALAEMFILDTSKDPATVTTLATGTNGGSLGDITANGALIAMSEADGTLDAVITNGAGTVYLAVRLANGKIFTCPVIHS